MNESSGSANGSIHKHLTKQRINMNTNTDTNTLTSSQMLLAVISAWAGGMDINNLPNYEAFIETAKLAAETEVEAPTVHPMTFELGKGCEAALETLITELDSFVCEAIGYTPVVLEQE